MHKVGEQVLKVVEDNNYYVRGTLGERTPLSTSTKSIVASCD